MNKFCFTIDGSEHHYLGTGFNTSRSSCRTTTIRICGLNCDHVVITSNWQDHGAHDLRVTLFVTPWVLWNSRSRWPSLQSIIFMNNVLLFSSFRVVQNFLFDDDKCPGGPVRAFPRGPQSAPPCGDCSSDPEGQARGVTKWLVEDYFGTFCVTSRFGNSRSTDDIRTKTPFLNSGDSPEFDHVNCHVKIIFFFTFFFYT